MRIQISRNELSYETAKADIFSDKEFLSELSVIANKNKLPVETAKKICSNYLMEIAARYTNNKLFWSITESIVRRRIIKSFDNIFYEPDNVRAIEDFSKDNKGNIVTITPNHRSVYDFIILPYILIKETSLMPTILAADVFNRFPIGYIFKKMGAYFVRRNEVDEPYNLVFKHYVMLILNYRVTHMFFIEGGRVKSGGYAEPKIGILKWMGNWAKKYKLSRDIAFFPVNISYDFVPESNVVVEEYLTGKRQPISRSLVNYFIKKNLGNCYINFGKPIYLSSVLDEYNSEYKINALGNKLMQNIKSLVIAPPTSLLCYTLLNINKEKVPLEEFFLSFKINYEKLKSLNCNIKYISLDKIDNYIEFAEGKKLIKYKNKEIIIDKKTKPIIEYHSNNIRHLFVG